MNEEATKQYHQTIIAIDREIETLKSQIAEYDQNNAKINWANVGDMQHILSQLKQLNGKEEE